MVEEWPIQSAGWPAPRVAPAEENRKVGRTEASLVGDSCQARVASSMWRVPWRLTRRQTSGGAPLITAPRWNTERAFSSAVGVPTIDLQ